ncbi:hypothetical protein C4K27_1008 [Pseudomonas chlororaphis subsp. chlororaphis]|nr:hypothetical protein C4K27_1008 [Pseudomonas chlororaphis subsp. chlororaphis]
MRFCRLPGWQRAAHGVGCRTSCSRCRQAAIGSAGDVPLRSLKAFGLIAAYRQRLQNAVQFQT